MNSHAQKNIWKSSLNNFQIGDFKKNTCERRFLHLNGDLNVHDKKKISPLTLKNYKYYYILCAWCIFATLKVILRPSDSKLWWLDEKYVRLRKLYIHDEVLYQGTLLLNRYTHFEFTQIVTSMWAYENYEMRLEPEHISCNLHRLS